MAGTGAASETPLFPLASEPGPGDAATLALRIDAGSTDGAPTMAAAAPIGALGVIQRSEVTFIEGNVGDLQTLLKGMAGAEVHVLDAGRDGLAQIAEILAGRSGIDAVHIISHGATGAVGLGALTLNSEGLSAHQAQLAAIGASLTLDGDILLYGCDVGAGTLGRAFVDQLAVSTGADVGASSNLTGAGTLGGDWTLEVASGQIDTPAVVDPTLAGLYGDVLRLTSATINFNSPGNFASSGTSSSASNDAIYRANGNASYLLKIDGASEGIVNFGNGYLAVGYAAGETQVTFSFTGGQVFTATSLKVTNYSGNTQGLIFKGYDASGHQVGGTQTLTNSGGISTVNFSGLSNIATLKAIADPTYGSRVYGLAFDDFSISNVGPAAAIVTSVTSTTTNGAYKAGSVIDISIGFDSAVDVTGTPQLTLETGAVDRVVNYVSGSGGSTLHFTYTVQAGDSSADLDLFSSSALTLNGGTIKVAGDSTDAILTLPSPGAVASLGANKNLVIDTTAPTVAITSNVSALKAGETATITFTFSENPGASFSSGDITVSGGTLGAISGSGVTRTATFTPTANTNGGMASITVAAISYTDAADNLGGAGSSPSLTFDTLAPNAPSAPDLAAGSDTGVSSSDDVTKLTTPTVSGTAEAGATVRLYDTDGVTQRGSATADGSGNWSITSSTLSAGMHTLTAKATDAAGNVSSASSGLSIIIDTTAPTVAITSSASALKIGETATVTFTFSEDPGSTFTWNGSAGDVVVTGGTLSAISGTGLTRTASFTPTADTDGGTASISVGAGSYTDTAGNGGGAGATPSLTFDTRAPGAPSAPDLSAGSDTGASNSDDITKLATPTLAGTSDAGATVRLYDTDGVTLLGTTTADGAGNWVVTASSLTAGAHTLTARAIDGAGNISTASPGLSVVIDATAPSLAISSDVSALKVGETAVITFTFSEDPGASFTWDGSAGAIAVSGGTLGALSGSGLIRTAIFTPTANTNGGMAAISVTGGSYIDTAGNSGAAGVTPSLTFDTRAPNAPSTPDLTAGSDDGASSTDNVTGVLTPTFAGTAEAGATVRLYDTDGVTQVGAGTADGSGNWSIATSTLGGGSHTISAKATDAAGNVSAASGGLSVTIQTPNNTPTGGVTITGAATQNQILTAANTLADADGLGTISYRWKSDGAAITGATAPTFILTQAQVGHAITVTASYTDGLGAQESITSAATGTVANVNDAPTGAVTIAGTPSAGQVLTAANTLADVDGLGAISYQWKSGGANISGATGATFTLTDAQAGRAVTVTASYTDGFGAHESVTSGAVNVDAPPPEIDPAPPVAPVPPGVVTKAVPGGVVVTGDSAANIITVPASGSAETVSAGGGDDSVTGGDGADVLQGNPGDDSMAAGAGADLVYGGQGADVLQGNTGDDVIFGDKGDDRLFGGQGSDSLQGGQGGDTVNGDLGDDVVRGGQGDDHLLGGVGADYLSGDTGADTLTGGAGADTFHSFGGAGIDVITDFNRADGDRILLDPGSVYTVLQQGADVHVSLAGGGEVILAGVQLASLTGAWITI